MKPLPRFIVVIDAKNEEQASQQAQLAIANGAGGVILINHRVTLNQLIMAYERTRSLLPDAWIGLNFLNTRPYTAVARLPEGADGHWLDTVWIHSDINVEQFAKPLAEASQSCGGGTKFHSMGSVAFKYQMHEPRPDWAAGECARLHDVVVTSGPATGSPPEVGKITAMKEACDGTPLAIASGISAENVGVFLPYADCFFVSTSISNADGLIPEKVQTLASLINDYK